MGPAPVGAGMRYVATARATMMARARAERKTAPMYRFVSIGTNRRTLKKAPIGIDAIAQCVIFSRSAKKSARRFPRSMGGRRGEYLWGQYSFEKMARARAARKAPPGPTQSLLPAQAP
jgi:hypothetical protein